MSNGLTFRLRKLAVFDDCSGCHKAINPHAERWEAKATYISAGTAPVTKTVVRCRECVTFLSNISLAMTHSVESPLYRSCEREVCGEEEPSPPAGERKGATARVYVPSANERGATAFLAKGPRVRST